MSSVERLSVFRNNCRAENSRGNGKAISRRILTINRDGDYETGPSPIAFRYETLPALDALQIGRLITAIVWYFYIGDRK